MMKKFIFLSLLLFVALGCRISVDMFDPPAVATPVFNAPATATPIVILSTPTPVVILPPATTTALPPTPINDTPALTVDQLKNGRFDLPGSDNLTRNIQFSNGIYQEGSDSSQPGYISVVIVDPIAFGDLDGDGATDAAVIIAENYGGTGVFVSVAAFLNRGGLPVYAASHFVDDRAIINSISIVNSEIFLDATIHGPNDPGCCATQPTTQMLKLWNGALVLSNFASKTPAGTDRIITIKSPANDSLVDKVFSILGNVTIAPFENNLVYNIYIPGMTDPFTQGPLTVNAPDLGAPGSFDLPLNFSAAGYSGPVRITISDLSAADGSILAQDTLFVTVK